MKTGRVPADMKSMFCSRVRIEVVKVVLTISTRPFTIADVTDIMQRKGISCASYTITTTLRILWMKGYLTRSEDRSFTCFRGRPELYYKGSPRLEAVQRELLSMLQ